MIKDPACFGKLKGMRVDMMIQVCFEIHLDYLAFYYFGPSKKMQNHLLKLWKYLIYNYQKIHELLLWKRDLNGLVFL